MKNFSNPRIDDGYTVIDGIVYRGSRESIQRAIAADRENRG